MRPQGRPRPPRVRVKARSYLVLGLGVRERLSATRGRSSSTSSSPTATWSSSWAPGSRSSPGAEASFHGDRTSLQRHFGLQRGESHRSRSRRCRTAGRHLSTQTQGVSSCTSWVAWPRGTPRPRTGTLPFSSTGAASRSPRGRPRSRPLSFRACATSGSGMGTARLGSGCSRPRLPAPPRRQDASTPGTRSAAGPPSSGQPASWREFLSGCWTSADWGKAVAWMTGQASWLFAPTPAASPPSFRTPSRSSWRRRLSPAASTGLSSRRHTDGCSRTSLPRRTSSTFPASGGQTRSLGDLRSHFHSAEASGGCTSAGTAQGTPAPRPWPQRCRVAAASASWASPGIPSATAENSGSGTPGGAPASSRSSWTCGEGGCTRDAGPARSTQRLRVQRTLRCGRCLFGGVFRCPAAATSAKRPTLPGLPPMTALPNTASALLA
mmetsp:Transcript_6735/g.21585  ORF Transcript_6735/g.21585 Transcript_6735/m.21585 type:complete len:437 (-) Transcript_6735:74-1384(-)